MAFLLVKCKNCSNKQTICETPSTIVKCLKCNVTIQKPNGGKATVRGEILEEMKK